MRIGILGNTNNYPLMLAMVLRKFGCDVTLVLTEKDILNRPEGRYPEFKDKYPSWIIDASQLTEWDFISLSPSLSTILDQVSNCDAFVLNSYCVSLLPLLGAPGVAFLTGSDLSHYANPESVQARIHGWDSTYAASPEAQLTLRQLNDLVHRQREGIRQAVAVRYMPRGIVPRDDKLLEEIGVPDSNRIFMAPAELERVKLAPAPHNQPVRVFCATRLTWKGPIDPGRSPLDYKGSDIMVHGIGQFYRETGMKLDIHLVRKGFHIEELQDIINEEGLSDQITWSDVMPLTQVWDEFAKADIVFDQLSDSAIGMAGLDAMATGRPVIGNARPEVFEDLFEGPSPICQARTPEEVCAQLKRLVYDPAERERIGLAGRNYVEKYFNPQNAGKTILEILQSALTDSKDQTSRRLAHSYYLQRLDTLQHEVLSSQHEVLSTQQELLGTKQKLLLSVQQEQHLAQTLDLYKNTYSSVPAQILGKWITDKKNNGRKRFERLKGPFQQQDGLCWIFQFAEGRADGDSPNFPHRSNLLVYEEDRLLGPAHAPHEDIRRKGAGRYSHWETALYFSTSDGSDPNTNGRRYTVIWP